MLINFAFVKKKQVLKSIKGLTLNCLKVFCNVANFAQFFVKSKDPLLFIYTYIKGWSFVFKSWCNGPSKDFRKGEFWWETYNEFFGCPFLLGKNSFTRKPFKIKTVNRKYVHIIYFWPIQAHVFYGLFSKKIMMLFIYSLGVTVFAYFVLFSPFCGLFFLLLILWIWF